MSKKKLLEKLQAFFDADQQEKLQRLEQIKKVLKKLKEKERKIQQDAEQSKEPEAIAALQQELDIIYAQRMKGVKIIKELQK